MAARRVLLSGYSGAGADIRMAEVSAEGRLRGGEGLRHGENPSFCCRMDGRVYAVAELPPGGVRHRVRPGGGRPAAAGAHGAAGQAGTVPPGGGGRRALWKLL